MFWSGFLVGFLIGAFFMAFICILIQKDIEEYFIKRAVKKYIKNAFTMRQCVMCNLALHKNDESKKWFGAHSWCETDF